MGKSCTSTQREATPSLGEHANCRCGICLLQRNWNCFTVSQLPCWERAHTRSTGSDGAQQQYIMWWWTGQTGQLCHDLVLVVIYVLDLSWCTSGVRIDTEASPPPLIQETGCTWKDKRLWCLKTCIGCWYATHWTMRPTFCGMLSTVAYVCVCALSRLATWFSQKLFVSHCLFNQSACHCF